MTLTRPKVDVLIQDSAPPGVALTSTGTAFIVGLALKGTAQNAVDGVAAPLDPTVDGIHNMDELIAKHGARQTYNGLEYDAAEAAFADGVNVLYWSRKVGPSAVRASGAVPASSSQFTAKAKGPGAYANTYTVTVASSVITVRDGSTVIDTSPVLADVAAAQTWATQTSTTIDIIPIGSGALTNSAAVTMTGGADDRASITDVEIQNALNRFGKNLGPGNVAAPGDTRTAMHQMLAQHALDRNRWAYGDAPDSATNTTVTAAGTAVRALGRDLARKIVILDGWGYMPPLTASGSQRTVPGSGVMLGGAATIDAQGNPNVAIAGANFASRAFTGVKRQRTETELDALAAAGVTPLVFDDGAVRPMDDITPVDPDVDPEWLGAAGGRMMMRIVADVLTIGKAHQFKQTAPKLEISGFHGNVAGMLQGWLAKGALFTDETGTEASAFRVETADPVNTLTTIALKQLNVALALKLTPNSRQVTAKITNTPVNGTL